MTATGKDSAVLVSSMRVMNSQGEWAPLKPLPDFGGQSGVLLALVNGASATFWLRVRLQLPPGQRPGKYIGLLTLEAH